MTSIKLKSLIIEARKSDSYISDEIRGLIGTQMKASGQYLRNSKELGKSPNPKYLAAEKELLKSLMTTLKVALAYEDQPFWK